MSLTKNIEENLKVFMKNKHKQYYFLREVRQAIKKEEKRINEEIDRKILDKDLKEVFKMIIFLR